MNLDDLKTSLITDAAPALGFRTTRQFLNVWRAAGYRTFKPSPRKHVVLISDVAKYLGERIVRLSMADGPPNTEKETAHV